MSIKKCSVNMVLATTVVLFSGQGFSDNISQGKILASACYSCHGLDGVGSRKIPELNTLTRQDITESLFGFKTGDERSTIMGRYMAAYTDKEIEIMAEYLSSLKN